MTPAEIIGIGFAILSVPTGIIAYLWHRQDSDHAERHKTLEATMKEAATKEDVERLYVTIQDLSQKILMMGAKLPNGELKRMEATLIRMETVVEQIAKTACDAVKKADEAKQIWVEHRAEAGVIQDHIQERVKNLEEVVERRKEPRGDKNAW